MAGDLEVWLQAAPGFSLPKDCFAVVQQGGDLGSAKLLGGAGAGAAPVRCAPEEANRLCSVSRGGGSLAVDLFQKVGSIGLKAVEPGAWSEEAILWPGLAAELRLHLAVAASAGLGSPPSAKQLDEDTIVTQLSQAVIKAEQLLEPRKPRAPSQKFLSACYSWASTCHVALPSQIIEEEPPMAPPVPQCAELALQLDPGRSDVAGHLSAVRGSLASLSLKKRKVSFDQISLANCDQIIPNLYLGGVAAAVDPQSLVRQGIRAVCCCCRELEFRESDFSPHLAYFRVDIEDMGKEPLLEYLPSATSFINSWLSREQAVLVHCRAGVSRSAAVVIAYLMRYHSYRLYDAFFLVRSHRSVISPNIGFMDKLGDYEQTLHEIPEPTIDMNKYNSWYQSPERAAVPDLRTD